jgi:hypothetical protein
MGEYVSRSPTANEMGFALPAVLELRRYSKRDLHDPQALLL